MNPAVPPASTGSLTRVVHFETAYCQVPLCTPSRMSMSLAATRICALLWTPGCPPLPPTWGAHGYATAAVGKMHLPGSCQYVGFGARPYGDFDAPSPSHQKDPLSLPGVRDHIFMPSIIDDVGLSDIPESMLQEQVSRAKPRRGFANTSTPTPDSPGWRTARSCIRTFP